jgi:hypothetical protein
LLGIVLLLTWHFTYLPLVITAFSLNSANVVGYTKCEKDAKKKLQSAVAAGVMSNLMGDSGNGWGRLFSLFR